MSREHQQTAKKPSKKPSEKLDQNSSADSTGENKISPIDTHTG